MRMYLWPDWPPALIFVAIAVLWPDTATSRRSTPHDGDGGDGGGSGASGGFAFRPKEHDLIGQFDFVSDRNATMLTAIVADAQPFKKPATLPRSGQQLQAQTAPISTMTSTSIWPKQASRGQRSVEKSAGLRGKIVLAPHDGAGGSEQFSTPPMATVHRKPRDYRHVAEQVVERRLLKQLYGQHFAWQQQPGIGSDNLSCGAAKSAAVSSNSKRQSHQQEQHHYSQEATETLHHVNSAVVVTGADPNGGKRSKALHMLNEASQETTRSAALANNRQRALVGAKRSAALLKTKTHADDHRHYRNYLPKYQTRRKDLRVSSAVDVAKVSGEVMATSLFSAGHKSMANSIRNVTYDDSKPGKGRERPNTTEDKVDNPFISNSPKESTKKGEDSEIHSLEISGRSVTTSQSAHEGLAKLVTVLRTRTNRDTHKSRLLITDRWPLETVRLEMAGAGGQQQHSQMQQWMKRGRATRGQLRHRSHVSDAGQIDAGQIQSDMGMDRGVVVERGRRVAQAQAQLSQPSYGYSQKKGVKKGQASIVFTAIEGGSVSLPCTVTPGPEWRSSGSDGDEEMALVLWYKDDIPAPLFTIDARETGGDLQSARQSSLDMLKDRAVFTFGWTSSTSTSSIDGFDHREPPSTPIESMHDVLTTVQHAGSNSQGSSSSSVAQLQLEPVRGSDEGEYRCRVDFKRARSINTVVNLRVIVPPGMPVIETTAGVTLQGGLAGPFNEGDPLSLHCYTKDVGRPRAALFWTGRQGHVIDDSFTFDHLDTTHSVVRNTLEIGILQREHLLAGFSCQATNNNITEPSKTSITLDLNLKPLDISIQPAPRPLSVGVTAELVCSSSGSRPPAILSWWKGDKQLQATKEDFPKGGLSTSTLSFAPEPEDDGKVLVCRAENPAIAKGATYSRRSAAALKRSWTLDVHYTPRVSVSLGGGLRSGEIHEGRDVYLECDIKANPLVHEILWHFNGTTELHTDKDKDVPRCRNPSERRVYGVDIHETAQIWCDLDADPIENIHFSWAFNNSQQGKRADLSSLASAGAHRASRAMINYKPLTEQDYGELVCFGRNEVGEQVEPCVYHIVAAAIPDPPRNCSQVNATENGLTVECSEGAWNGNAIVQSQLFYIAELYSVRQNRNSDDDISEKNDEGSTLQEQNQPWPISIANVTVDGTIGISTPVFVFSELPRSNEIKLSGDAEDRAGVGQSYRVRLYAQNHKGRSAVKTLTVHLLNTASNYQTEQSTSHLGVAWVVRPLLGLMLGLLVSITTGGFALFALLKCNSKQQSQQKHGSHTDVNKGAVAAPQTNAGGNKSMMLSLLKGDATSAQFEDSPGILQLLPGDQVDAVAPSILVVSDTSQASELSVLDLRPPDIIQRHPGTISNDDEMYLTSDEITTDDGGFYTRGRFEAMDMFYRLTTLRSDRGESDTSKRSARRLSINSGAPTKTTQGAHNIEVYSTLGMHPQDKAKNALRRQVNGSLSPSFEIQLPTHCQQQQYQHHVLVEVKDHHLATTAISTPHSTLQGAAARGGPWALPEKNSVSLQLTSSPTCNSASAMLPSNSSPIEDIYRSPGTTIPPSDNGVPLSDSAEDITTVPLVEYGPLPSISTTVGASNRMLQSYQQFEEQQQSGSHMDSSQQAAFSPLMIKSSSQDGDDHSVVGLAKALKHSFDFTTQHQFQKTNPVESSV
ncbi:uncharacterized protein LOC111249032 isoform X4 [Varroa destructor]|uniref:Ig-like domain-containing protein n=1 Tax=Varroa destructor TaxID=109461 RepID=A0A7M7K5R3_VARDE|nr:uncharacterized protein LOC111249032 isoform X4 [Varroa destructor]